MQMCPRLNYLPIEGNLLLLNGVTWCFKMVVPPESASGKQEAYFFDDGMLVSK